MKGRKTSKRAGKRMAKRSAMRRRRVGTREWASASQTLELMDDQTRQVYQLSSINLSQFDRLSQIARAYQYFRITHVEMKFRPYFDTFANDGTPGGQVVPYLYWLINKSQNNNIASFNALQDAGAKPIRFDERTITVRWKPAVLQYLRDKDPNTGTAVPNFTLSRVSPWLATSQNAGTLPSVNTWAPNEVEHTGILYGGNTTLGVPPAPYGTTIIVHAQFKKPLNEPAGNQVELATVKEITSKPSE